MCYKFKTNIIVYPLGENFYKCATYLHPYIHQYYNNQLLLKKSNKYELHT